MVDITGDDISDSTVMDSGDDQEEVCKRLAEKVFQLDKELAEHQRKKEIEKRQRENRIKSFPADIQNCIKNKQVQIGMTEEQVILSWGRPKRINESVGRWGRHEQWVYSDSTYIYFENGILTSWQGIK